MHDNARERTHHKHVAATATPTHYKISCKSNEKTFAYVQYIKLFDRRCRIHTAPYHRFNAILEKHVLCGSVFGWISCHVYGSILSL